MSKFIERLQKVLQPAAQSMGFQTVKSEHLKPKLQLVVNITNGKVKSQIKELDNADALLLPAPAIRGGKEIPGAWLTKGNAEEVEKSTKAGADFVILSVSGEALPSDKKIGKILQVDAAITDIMLRTVSILPVDAVLLAEEEGVLALTWKRLMLIHRFSGLTGKPLLVEVLPAATETELQQIWDAGVSGIVVKTDAEQAEAVAQNLRNIIDKLTFPSRRKNEKGMAIVPQVAIAAEAPKEDDGDGDGDGDDE